MTDKTVSENKGHANAFSALLAAQPHFKAVKKDAQNTHFKNEYSTLHALLEATLPALNEAGLVLFQPIEGGETGYFVKTVLHHADSGTQIETAVPLLMGKQDMQQLKSASTYAKRIGLENLTGVASGDDAADDDGDSNRKGNPMGAAMSDAWMQGVEDSIPENATPRQKAEAYARAICDDFNAVNGIRALDNRWNKHRNLIGQFEARFSDLHGNVVDAYENAKMRVTGNDTGVAAE